MKKLVIIIILFLMPLFVFAEEQCSNDSVVIKSIGQVDKSLEVEDLTKSDVQGNDVELDLKMFEVGNYIEYRIVIKNIEIWHSLLSWIAKGIAQVLFFAFPPLIRCSLRSRACWRGKLRGFSPECIKKRLTSL